MPDQLVLPLATAPALTREDFIAAPCNTQALAFIDSYPNWPAPAAALYGPSGSGKSHLAHVWATRAGAMVVDAAQLDHRVLAALTPGQPLVVENVDHTAAPTHEAALFALLERGNPLLLTAREAPSSWPVLLPDLASRYRALLAFALWEPDEQLLTALAGKLLADRQLVVPAQVVSRMLAGLERSPAAIRDFIALMDERALSQKRAVTLGLLRDLMAERGDPSP
jgi:chromosomal replication initiation ATPase DnaA